MKRKKSFLSKFLKLIIVLIIFFGISIPFCKDFYKKYYNKAYNKLQEKNVFFSCKNYGKKIYNKFYISPIEKIKGYYCIHKGDKALKKGDLQDAIYNYEKGIKHYPKHYRALYNLANIYVIYEDYYSAIKNYEKALIIKPDYDIARINYAIILSQVYKIDEAIEEYEKVLKYRPKYIKIPFLVDSKKSYEYNRGVAYYNMGLAYRTKSMMAGLNKETSYEYLKHATDSYEKAIDILHSYNSNYNLGLIHQLLKNRHQAAYYYCKAIEIDPMSYEAHFNYAILLNDLQRYQAAQTEFKKAGLLLDSKGESVKTKYIYEILNEVNKKIAIETDKDYYKKIAYEEDEFIPKLKAGKVVLNENNPKEIKKQQKALIESFSKCADKEDFIGNDKNGH